MDVIDWMSLMCRSHSVETGRQTERERERGREKEREGGRESEGETQNYCCGPVVPPSEGSD